jgi:hypothetical protein
MFVFVVVNFLVIPLAFIEAHPHAAAGPSSSGFVTPGVAGWLQFDLGAPDHRHRRARLSPPGSSSSSSRTSSTSGSRPRWINYERADTVDRLASSWWFGAALLMVDRWPFGLLRHRALRGHFTDAGGVAQGLQHYVAGRAAGIDLRASCSSTRRSSGRRAVTLATSYAFGDVFGVASLAAPSSWREAKLFYGAFSRDGGPVRPRGS